MVEVQSTDGARHGAPAWYAYWMELGAPRRVSIEFHPDPAATIGPAAWRRARQAFGPPLAIRVLDDDTARRVRDVVPARVTVIVTPDEPSLRAMATIGDDDEDDLDLPISRMFF